MNRIRLNLSHFLFLLPVGAFSFFTPVFVSGSEEIPKLSQEIDARLKQVWQQEKISPTAPVTDEEFVRRLFLDLTGRIPRVAEIHQFLENESPNRRSELINELLSRPRHAVHLANLWRKYLLAENLESLNSDQIAGFEEWLRARFRKNVPYNQLVKELLLAEGSFSEVGPALYFSSVQLKPEELARSTSRTFLGIQIDCAQCHDHPFDNWKQTDFWGYAAFFAQITPGNNNPQMMLPATLTDTSVGEVMLPDSEEAVPPKFFLTTTPASLDRKTRRLVLADWVTASENPFFAKATVNRIWAHLFGKGIVDPPDNFSSSNPPVDEELLNLIANDFTEHDFDLRHLIRAIVNTEAYQLSSHSGKTVEETLSADPQVTEKRIRFFAQHALKPFTADQLFDCLALATSRPLRPETAGMNNQNQQRIAFIQKFQRSSNDQTQYEGGIPQALTLLNGAMIDSSVGLESSNLLQSLQAPFFSDEKRLHTLFLATLSHPPSEELKQEFLSYLNNQPSSEEKRQALSNILWALLNSAEFTMNQ